MKYDCLSKYLIIPKTNQIKFGIAKGCGANYFTLHESSSPTNLIQAELQVSNYEITYDNNCPDPPGQGCNTCPLFAQFSYKLNFDLSQISQVTGALKIYENNVLVNTLNINNLSHFTNPQSYQTYYGFKIQYDLIFTLTNGEAFTVNSFVQANGQFCEIEDYLVINNFDYDFSIIPIELADGFYTISLNNSTHCLQINCNGDFECQIYDCKDCNIDSFMLMLAYEYCEDCCTKNLIWRNLNDELNKCTKC